MLEVWDVVEASAVVIVVNLELVVLVASDCAELAATMTLTEEVVALREDTAELPLTLAVTVVTDPFSLVIVVVYTSWTILAVVVDVLAADFLD